MATANAANAVEIDGLAELRHRLIDNGYKPIPVDGKSPKIKGWQKQTSRADHVEGLIRAHPDHTNTGLLTGDLVAIDIDVPDTDTCSKIVELVLDLPGGPQAPCRTGRAPKCLFVFRATEPRKKVTTDKYRIGEDRCQVEVLGTGNQFVAYGIHPDTGKVYDWQNGEPTAIPFAHLPEIAPDALDAFLADAEAVLADRGEPERKAKPTPANDGYVPTSSGDGSWGDIKAHAMDNLSAWVPSLGLERLTRYQSGYLAVASFRHSMRPGLSNSKRGQALEISPQGICDHSDGDRGYSPIDLVMTCLGVEARQAADWLRDRVGGSERPAKDDTPLVGIEKMLRKAKTGAEPTPAPKPNNDNRGGYPGIVSSAEFLNDFRPPDYHIDGVIQSGFLYSTTAGTGAGKTAVLLHIAALTALGEPLGEREVKKSRVVYFAGENPDDIKMRWIAMEHAMDFDRDWIDVHFISGVFDIPGMFKKVAEDVRKLGGADLVIIDTSAAYFRGTEENSNTELGNHARSLRALTTLPGAPCVMVACHPTKNASQDNLQPRGGGAFVAEVDGNLVLLKGDDGVVKLHHQVKHRGVPFDPIGFDLKTVTAPALKDSKGRDIPTVMATPISESEQRSRKDKARRDVDEVLIEIEKDGKRSQADIADALGWRAKDGVSDRHRVRRAADKLKADKLVHNTGKRWTITKAGQDMLVDAKDEKLERDRGAHLAAGLTRKRA